MTVQWNSLSAPAGDRAAAVRDAIVNEVVRVDIELPDDPEDIDVSLQLSVAKSVQILSVQSMATTVTRSPRFAKADSEPQLFLTLQRSGSSAMAQHNRYATLRKDEFAVYTTASPYTLMFDRGLDAHFFRLPVAELALPEAAVREISARALGRCDPVAGLTAAYLKRVAESSELRAATVADRIADPTIDLVRAAIVSALGDSSLSSESLEATLELRILEYMRLHLADHDLGAVKIAAAHHISVRQLYAVLARAGIGLGDWLRTQRLEACRRELARPQSRSRTIGSVAHQWGFTNMTHFSRVFRDAYGISPREWRKAKGRLPATLD